MILSVDAQRLRHVPTKVRTNQACLPLSLLLVNGGLANRPWPGSKAESSGGARANGSAHCLLMVRPSAQKPQWNRPIT